MKNRLRYFVAVADEQHFGRAAEKLNMSQPPLSQQIQLLEKELGLQLFVRSTRHVELTDAGRVLHEGAKRALDQLDQAILRAQRVHRGEAGLLRVAFVSTAAFQLLSDVLRAFRKRYPEITLELYHMTSLEQAAAFEGRTIDIGFLRDPPGGDVDFEIIDRERLVVALPAGHPLARQKTVRVRALKDQPFVMWHRQQSPGMSQTTLELCNRHGFRPSIALEVTNPHAMLSLVAGDVGVAIVPTSRSYLRPDSVVFRALDDKSAYSPIGLAWRTDNSVKLVECFAALVREVCGRNAKARRRRRERADTRSRAFQPRL